MVNKSYGLIDSIDDVRSLVSKLIQDGLPFGFDIETGYDGPAKEKASLRPEVGFVVGFSITNSTEWARYIPLRHDMAVNVDPEQFALSIWPLMQTGLGVAHNAKFEASFLNLFFKEFVPNCGNGSYPVRSDTMVESYMVQETRNHGLKGLVKELFGHNQPELVSLFPEMTAAKMKAIRFNALDLTPGVISYACEDAAWCLALHERNYPKVKDMLLFKTEMKLLPILTEMERYGLRYDWTMMSNAANELETFITRWHTEIMEDLSEVVGEPVNINLGSPQQVSAILYDRIGLSTTRMTKSSRDGENESTPGKMSTDSIALEGLSQKYGYVKKMVEWREMKKLLTTYLETYQKKFQYARDGRTHPSIAAAFILTGRFAVSDPPYQQCLSGDTEVLTPDGWCRLDQMGEHGDEIEVAQFVPGDTPVEDGLEFVQGQLVATPCHTDMVQIGSADELAGTARGRKGEFGTWLYTPDHRMIYRSRLRGGASAIKETTAQQWEQSLSEVRVWPQGRRLERRIPKAGYRIGGRQLSDTDMAVLELAIMLQADGNRRTDGRGGSVWYDVELYKRRKIIVLEGLHGGGKVTKRGSTRWHVKDDVSEWLDSEKNFRADSILALCADDLRHFLAVVMLCDGDSTRKATYSQSVERRRSVEVVQAAAALCGKSTSFYERPEYDAVSVNVSDQQYRDSSWQSVRRVPSPDGRAYCVTVPSGYILVRNSTGHVQVTGNTPKKYHYVLKDGTEFNLDFRKAIQAGPGHFFVGFDYSQVELRWLAGVAQEPSLLKDFADGTDVHTRTASLMLGKSMDQVTSEDRAVGKTMNFALLYGMGVKSLGERLGISTGAAKTLMEQYFSAFSSIAVWSARIERQGTANGYTTSVFGRKHKIWELESKDMWIRAKGERMCVNTPIQGGAADYMKIAMVRADKALRDHNLSDKVHLVMNIHDALVYEAQNDVPVGEIIQILEPAISYDVKGFPPILAEWGVGRRWGTMVDIVLHDDGTVSKKNDPESRTAPSEPIYSGSKRSLNQSGSESAAHKAITVVERQLPIAPIVESEITPKPVNLGMIENTPTIIYEVIIELREQPTVEQLTAFQILFNSQPGENKIEIHFNDEIVRLPGTTNLSIHDASRINAHFHGCEVHYSPQSIDGQSLTKDLVF